MSIRRSLPVSSILMTSLMLLVALLPLASASLPVPHVTTAPTFVGPPTPLEQVLPDGSRAITYTKATNYEQLVNWYTALENQYPNYLKVWKANQDYGYPLIGNRSGGAGYDYWMVRLTNESRAYQKPEVLFIGNPHGDETAGPEGQYWFCSWILRNALTDTYNTTEDDWLNWLLDHREIYLVVSHNPDGFNNQGDWTGRYDFNGHDLNREADWDFRPNSGMYDTGPNPWLETNGKTLYTFIDHHMIRVGADMHGGARMILYPFSSKHDTVQATSQKSSVTYDFAPPDFNYYDISSLRLGKFMGGFDGGFDSSNVGPVPPTVGYQAPGGIVSWAYGADVINHTVEDPYVLDETYGNYNGTGILWVSPELSNVKDISWVDLGGDSAAGYGPDVRRFILHQTDLAQPYIWVPKGSIANNSVVNAGDDMNFFWKVNGCLAVDNTYIQWGKDPNPITNPTNTTKQNDFYKGKYWGGSGWENADSGSHDGFTWSEAIKAPNQTGDYYFVIKAMVDQVFGNTSNSGVYGKTPYLDIVRERTDPSYSQTIQESNGPNTMKGQIWWYSDVIHIKVVKKPLVLSYYPKDKATWVPTDTNISVTFDIPMDHTLTEAAIKLNPATAGKFTWNGSQVIFNPDAPLASETSYAVTVNATAKSLMGTTMVSDVVFGFKTAFSSDIIAPKIVSTIPVNKATNVPVRTKVIVNFSEPMNTTTTQSAFGMVPVTAGTFSWQNNSSSMVFTPAKALDGPIDYVFSIGTGAMDLGKNHLPKLQSFTFKTEVPDRTPPSVLGTYPKDGAIMVPLNANVTINFSEPMLTANTEESFNITPSIQGTFSWNATKAALTFHPATPFPPETNYTVTINRSACDLGLNPLVKAYIFRFRSEDITPPTVAKVFPADKAKDVPVDTKIQIEFSELMDPDTTTGAISFSPKIDGFTQFQGVRFTIDPSTDLAYSTTYNITVSTAATDLDTVHMTATFTSSFTTGRPPDHVAPRVIRTDPMNGATNVSTYGQLTIIFSEAVVLPTTGDTITVSPTPAAKLQYTLDGAVLKVGPEQQGTRWLDENMPYTVLVSGGIADLAANPMGKDYSFAFTTGYATPPDIKKVDPADNATNVPTSASITVEFTRTMDWSSVKGALVISPGTEGTFTQSGNSIVFKPSSPLKDGQIYTVKVTRVAKDDKGNNLAKDYQWTFTTKAKPAKNNGMFGGGFLIPLLLMLIIVIIVIIIVALVLRSRRKRKEQDRMDADRTAAVPPLAPEVTVQQEYPPSPKEPAPEPEAPQAPAPQPEAPQPAPVQTTEIPKQELAPAPKDAGSELDDIINELSK